MMKVIAIHKNLALGGAEKILIDYAKQFQKENKVFDILLIENNIEFDKLEKLHISFLIDSKNVKKSKILLLIFWPYYLYKLITAVKKYDVVFSFERYPAYINFLISRLLGKKSVVYVPVPIIPCIEESFNGELLRKFHIFLHRFILNNTDLIIAISRGVKKEMIDRFGVKENQIRVIEPFIDSESIRLMSGEPLSKNESKRLDKKTVLISISRLNSQKNLSLLIKAFYELDKIIKNCILLIAGEGKERKKLEELIRRLYLDNKVLLLGAKNNPIKYLGRSDLFVLTSSFEGLGLVILEALVCRIPIVAVDSLYGIREIIAPELTIYKPINKTYINKYAVLIAQSLKIKKDLLLAIKYLLENKKIRKKLTSHNQEIIDKFQVRKKYELFLSALSEIL